MSKFMYGVLLFFIGMYVHAHEPVPCNLSEKCPYYFYSDGVVPLNGHINTLGYGSVFKMNVNYVLNCDFFLEDKFYPAYDALLLKFEGFIMNNDTSFMLDDNKVKLDKNNQLPITFGNDSTAKLVIKNVRRHDIYIFPNISIYNKLPSDDKRKIYYNCYFHPFENSN